MICCRAGGCTLAAAQLGHWRSHVGAAPGPHALQAVPAGALEGGGCCGAGITAPVGWQFGTIWYSCAAFNLLCLPCTTPAQSVLSIILGGDKQWLVRVGTVAGVVVLRTLLQVRQSGQGSSPGLAMNIRGRLVIWVSSGVLISYMLCFSSQHCLKLWCRTASQA